MRQDLLLLIQGRIARGKDDFIERLVRNLLVIDYKIPECPGPCYLWTGRVNNCEYPRINFRGVAPGDGTPGLHFTVYVHHLFWVLFHCIPIPEKHELDHRCYKPRCVNPAHLEAVPKLVNLERRRKRRDVGQAEPDTAGECTDPVVL